jgi:transposase-like protein
MIQVFDTRAARRALDRRLLPCPGCGAPLKPWGRVRERTVRDYGGALVTFRPDRGRCTGCDATHVILDARLLPGRAYAAGLTGQALASAACGHGHRHAAREAGVPDGTVRGWIRRARRSAEQLRVTGVRAVVALDPEALPVRVLADPLASALDALGAAAVAMGRRFGLHDAGLWARIAVLTRGRLLSLAPDS